MHSYAIIIKMRNVRTCVCSRIYVEWSKQTDDGEKQRKRGVGGERERDAKRALISFFPSTRGVSVKLIKFRENFYNTRPWKNVQVYTSWQFMLRQVATLCSEVGHGRARGIEPLYAPTWVHADCLSHFRGV